MSPASDDATPRTKRSDVKDLPAQPMDAEHVAGGATIRGLEPCLKPAIDPCVKPATLPGGVTNPIRGH